MFVMLEQNTQYLVNTLLMQVSVTDIYFVYNFKRNLFLIKYTKLSSFICAKIPRISGISDTLRKRRVKNYQGIKLSLSKTNSSTSSRLNYENTPKFSDSTIIEKSLFNFSDF